MPKSSLLRRVLAGSLSLLSAFTVFASIAQAQNSPGVVISQVYGGGGNSGATYKNDFIELFNPTSQPSRSPVTASSTPARPSSGSTRSQPLPSPLTLVPGQYFLIQAAAGTGGTTNPPHSRRHDRPNLSATAGKVALVNSTTALDGTADCPANTASVADFVGFGGTTTAVNCSLGSPAPCSPTPRPPSAPTSAPHPRQRHRLQQNFRHHPRSQHLLLPHTLRHLRPRSPLGHRHRNPRDRLHRRPTLLTVQVTPATQPASTGLQVEADLSAIGGSSSQIFFDDGTNGDLTAGDNIFSYTAATSSPGTFTLPVSVTDAQARTASASISLTAQIPPQFVTIRTIQANKPSTYNTQTLSTSGIVVSVKSNGFYIEARDADTHPVTPEGILVYTGSTRLPSYISLGAEVQVTGTVNTYPPTSPTPGTEIDGPQSFALLSSGNPLPTPIQITADDGLPFRRCQAVRKI